MVSHVVCYASTQSRTVSRCWRLSLIGHRSVICESHRFLRGDQTHLRKHVFLFPFLAVEIASRLY